MNHPHLGNLIDGDAKRDATHVAVAPVVAVEVLRPGDHIGFTEPGNSRKVGRKGVRPIGIVDPFLKTEVKPGQSFWMCMYPQSTQQLRHAWDHPEFTAREVARKLAPDVHEQRLIQIADDLGVSLSDLLINAMAYRDQGAYWNEGGKFEGMHIPSDFWEHFEAYTGEPAAQDRGGFLSCAC